MPLLCLLSPLIAAFMIWKYTVPYFILKILYVQIFEIKLNRYLVLASSTASFTVFITSYFFEQVRVISLLFQYLQTSFVIKSACWLTLPLSLLLPLAISNNMIERLLTFIGIVFLLLYVIYFRGFICAIFVIIDSLRIIVFIDIYSHSSVVPSFRICIFV